MADLISKPVETQPKVVEQPAAEAPKELGAVVEAARAAEEEKGIVAVERADASDEARESVPAEPVAPVPRVPVQAVVTKKDPTLQRIEDIMGEDLTDAFLKLSPDRQQKFKEKGEETASKIRQMIEGAKVNTKKIFDLIRKWLKMIPGINRFFLEQEAKIKTDKILNLRP